MSTSENISLWKKRSEIDYIPSFISLWLSLNAWMRDRYREETDRKMLELLKGGGNNLSEKFSTLIHADDANGSRFRGNLGELHRALVNANISYHKRKEKISFDCYIIFRSNAQPIFESVLRKENQKEKIKIDDNLWFEDNSERLFPAYIEIVYQIRCVLFHGDLAPIPENERIIKPLYITLSMIMENV